MLGTVCSFHIWQLAYDAPVFRSQTLLCAPPTIWLYATHIGLTSTKKARQMIQTPVLSPSSTLASIARLAAARGSVCARIHLIEGRDYSLSACACVCRHSARETLLDTQNPKLGVILCVPREVPLCGARTCLPPSTYTLQSLLSPERRAVCRPSMCALRLISRGGLHRAQKRASQTIGFSRSCTLAWARRCLSILQATSDECNWIRSRGSIQRKR